MDGEADHLLLQTAGHHPEETRQSHLQAHHPHFHLPGHAVLKLGIERASLPDETIYPIVYSQKLCDQIAAIPDLGVDGA